MNVRLILIAAAVAMLCMGGAHANSDERAKVEILHETTLNLIRLLVEQGVIKQEAADEMMRKAQQTAAKKNSEERPQEKTGQAGAEQAVTRQAETSQPKKGEVRVTYVPEHVKREIRDQLREEVVLQAKQERWGDVNAIPEWVSRFKMEGDIRLREQADFVPAGNAPAANFQAIGQQIDNTSEDSYNRERVRMRLGINANITKGVDLGLRLATGDILPPVAGFSNLNDSPTSTLQTFGNTGKKYMLWLDQVYLRFTPQDSFTVTAGRMPNPFFVGTVGSIYTSTLARTGNTIPMAGVVHTDLLWDVDVNFEGLAVNLHPWLKEDRAIKPFFNAGIFPLQQINQGETVKAKDKWFYGAQGGLEFAPADTDTKVRVGVAFYDFHNVSGIRNPAFGDTLYNQTAPQYRQRGNSLYNIDNDGNPTTNLWALAADYRVVNLTMVADYARFKPIHVIATADYARNVGYDQNKILSRTGQNITPETTAYQARLTVGYPIISQRHQWQVFGFYRHSERDSMLDAFTDSNYLGGGTNHKGFTIQGLYGVAHNTWFGLRYMSYNNISGLPLAVDAINLDLNARF